MIIKAETMEEVEALRQGIESDIWQPNILISNLETPIPINCTDSMATARCYLSEQPLEIIQARKLPFCNLVMDCRTPPMTRGHMELLDFLKDYANTEDPITIMVRMVGESNFEIDPTGSVKFRFRLQQMGEQIAAKARVDDPPPMGADW